MQDNMHAHPFKCSFSIHSHTTLDFGLMNVRSLYLCFGLGEIWVEKETVTPWDGEKNYLACSPLNDRKQENKASECTLASARAGEGERENLGKMLETVAWKVEKRHQEDGDCGEMLSFWWQFQFAVVCYPDFPLTLLHSFVAYIYHIEWPFYIVFLQRVLRGCCGLNCRWRCLLRVRPFIIQFITSGTHVCWIIEHVPASCSVTKLIFT